MKKFTVIIAFLAISIASAFGQSTADSITMKKEFGGQQFYQHGYRLNIKQLTSVIKTDEQAYKELRSAKAVYTTAMIFSYAGGFMVGWPIGTAIGGGEPNWVLAGIGAGLIVVAFSLSKSSNKKSLQAVDTYNSGLGKSAFWDKRELKLSMTGDGIGLILRL